MWIYGSHIYFTTAQVVFITAKIAFIFTSLSEVQIYDFHIFTFVYSPLHGYIWYQHDDQLPVGLLARLVEHCTGIARVMGSNPVQAWIFSDLIFTTSQIVFITAKIAFILTRHSVSPMFLPHFEVLWNLFLGDVIVQTYDNMEFICLIWSKTIMPRPHASVLQ